MPVSVPDVVWASSMAVEGTIVGFFLTLSFIQSSVDRTCTFSFSTLVLTWATLEWPSGALTDSDYYASRLGTLNWASLW